MAYWTLTPSSQLRDIPVWNPWVEATGSNNLELRPLRESWDCQTAEVTLLTKLYSTWHKSSHCPQLSGINWDLSSTAEAFKLQFYLLAHPGQTTNTFNKDTQNSNTVLYSNFLLGPQWPSQNWVTYEDYVILIIPLMWPKNNLLHSHLYSERVPHLEKQDSKMIGHLPEVNYKSEGIRNGMKSVLKNFPNL